MGLITTLLVAGGLFRLRTSAPQYTPAVWEVPGISGQDLADLRMENFGVEALVAFKGDDLVVVKPDGSPYTMLKRAFDKFFDSDNAPSYPVRPGFRMNYLVMRSSMRSPKFEPNKPHCTLSFPFVQGGDPFMKLMVDLEMSHCRVIPVYVPKEAEKADLEVIVNASFSGRLLPAVKGSDIDFRETKFTMLEYRRYRPSDGAAFPLDSATTRTTAIIHYDKPLSDSIHVREARKNFYVQGTWEYVDEKGILASIPFAKMDWSKGGVQTQPPNTMLVAHDTEKRLMTVCSNLAPSEIPGLSITMSRQYPAKLVGIRLIR